MNVGDVDGWTPLHAAAHWGQDEACKLLAEHQADVSATDHVVRVPRCLHSSQHRVLSSTDGRVLECAADEALQGCIRMWSRVRVSELASSVYVARDAPADERFLQLSM